MKKDEWEITKSSGVEVDGRAFQAERTSDKALGQEWAWNLHETERMLPRSKSINNSIDYRKNERSS